MKPFKKTVDEDHCCEEEQDFFMMRYFTVFNADQVEGKIAEKFQVKDEPSNGTVLPDYGPAEELIVATGAKICPVGIVPITVGQYPKAHGPITLDGDFIVVPSKHRYVRPGAYYETVLHELSHWSELRTGWDHGKQGYAMGELAAEIASSFLSAELGVPCGEDLANHAAYLQSWLNEMKGDPSYIFKASTQASKVTDFLLSLVRKEEPVVA